MREIPRLLPVTLLIGSVMLVVVTASSMGSAPTATDTAPAADLEEAEAAEMTPTDCYGALEYFSGDDENARYVIWRESRNDPTAQNARSTAAGCYQLLVKHSWRFEEVGCSWQQRYDPVCNTLAADHLYRAEGWEPWST